MGYAKRPSNYAFLKKIRASKTASLKPCPYMKESTKLRYYQVVGCLNLMCLNRMVLGDGAGLGKTIQLIASYVYCLQKDPTLKLLIIAPKSAVGQWAEEFCKFTKGIRVHVLRNRYGISKDGTLSGPVELLKKKGIKCKVLRGYSARKIQYVSVKANVLISSYYSLQNEPWFLLRNRGNNLMFVIDECQEIKSRKSKSHIGAKIIAEKSIRVYGLSATIIKNRLEEAYNIYRVIVPGLFGSVAKFNKNFLKLKKRMVIRGNKRFRFNEITGYKNLDDFKETIHPYFLIRRPKDVANELPSIYSKRIILDMTPKQHLLYRDALSGKIYKERTKIQYFEFRDMIEAATEVSEKQEEKLERLYNKYQESLTEDGMLNAKAAALTYCQMVSNGPQWLDEEEEGESSKEIEFRRIIDQELSCEKTIVFTRLKSGIHRLESILDEMEIGHVKITGDEDQDQRDKARTDFQSEDKDVPVIFITSAGSAALNLQRANVLLFYDTPWSYGDLYQTIGRAQRIGSVHSKIYVLHMINRKTIDEHVIKILESKKDLVGKVVGDIAEGALEFSKNKEIVLKEQEGHIDALFHSVFR